MHPTSHKGRLRVAIEDRLQEAAEERGVRVIIVRAGDYFGGGRGSWFDLVIARDITKLRLTYPGPVDVMHEWAYVPDLAASLVRLAAIRDRFEPFATFGFPGHAVTGREFTQAIAKGVKNRLQVKRMSWWLVHALTPGRTAVPGIVGDRLSVAGAAPDRRRQAHGGDRRRASHPA